MSAGNFAELEGAIEWRSLQLLRMPTERNAHLLAALIRLHDFMLKPVEIDRQRLGLNAAPRLPHNRGVA